jgi:hypothetical protein
MNSFCLKPVAKINQSNGKIGTKGCKSEHPKGPADDGGDRLEEKKISE